MDGRFGVSRSVGATKMSKQGAFGTAEELKPESSRISDAIVDVRDGIFRQSLSGNNGRLCHGANWAWSVPKGGAIVARGLAHQVAKRGVEGRQ